MANTNTSITTLEFQLRLLTVARLRIRKRGGVTQYAVGIT